MIPILDESVNYDDPNSYNGKVMGEKETRAKLLYRARCLGADCEYQLKKIMDKYDNLLKNCTNDAERQDMGRLGSIEIFNILDLYGKMYQNDKLIIVKD